MEHTPPEYDSATATNESPTSCVRQGDLRIEDTALLEKLAPVVTAHWNATETLQGCLPGTRDQLLQTINNWVFDSDQSPPVFWLTGLCGTGKTAVARTFCQQLAEKGQLGSSFFASRTSTERRDPINILHTFVHDLATQHPTFGKSVATAIEADPSITTMAMSEQFTQLLVYPLQKAEGVPSGLVLVLDALDECDLDMSPTGDGTTFFSLLIEAVHNLPCSIKIFISSRADKRIEDTFANIQEQHIQHVVVRLHEIEQSVVESDIRKYLRHAFGAISSRLSPAPEAEWPSDENLEVLVKRAGQLFIYATTIVRFIDDRNADPRERLATLLADEESTNHSPYDDLDRLYLQVLADAVDKSTPDYDAACAQIRTIVGAIIVLHEQVSVEALAGLLDLEIKRLGETLRKLSALLIVESETPIRIFHPSFPEFVTHKGRCSNEQFLVDQHEFNRRIARRCLTLMNRELVQDILHIDSVSLLNQDIPDLATRISQSTSPSLRYACENWIPHFLDSTPGTPDSIEELAVFCKSYLLRWIEVLSYTGHLTLALSQLSEIREWCQEHTGSYSDIQSLLHDAERLIREFYTIISTSAIQVYYSVLLFMPDCNLFQTAIREADLPFSLLTERPRSWGSSTLVLEGHTGAVDSIAISPDGENIVSGSEDGTVRLWHLKTGKNINTLKRRSNFTKMNDPVVAAYSFDGLFIAASTMLGAIQVRKVSNGEKMTSRGKFLNDHSRARCIAFSPDLSRIALGLSGNTSDHNPMVDVGRIMVRATREGRVGSALFLERDETADAEIIAGNRYPIHVHCVAFSSDGENIVSGYSDKRVHVSDADTGDALATFTGLSDQVHSVAFSSDASHIAAGCGDGSIYILELAATISGLNRADGAHDRASSRIVTATICLTAETVKISSRVILGHVDNVYSVAFTKDGLRLVSGSEDNTVRLWDAITGEAIARYEGHTRMVKSVAFSPDGRHIVSGSADYTIRVWDTSSPTQLPGAGGNDPIRSLMFSPDRIMVISCTQKNTINFWSTITGTIVASIKGMEWFSSIAFSLDRQLIAVGCPDHIIRLYDTNTGDLIGMLEGHRDDIRDVHFSGSHESLVLNTLDTSGLKKTWKAGEHFITLEPQSEQQPTASTTHDTATFSFDEHTGWLMGALASDTSKSRLCWIPTDLRPGIIESLDFTVALGSRTGAVTIIRVSEDL